MTTVNDIYEAALILIDANNDTDTSEYESKALGIVNVLRGECYPYSDTYDDTGPGRPICPLLTSMADSVGLDDYICQSVLPYGLGAHLLLDENPTTASYLNQRYQELLNELKMGRGLPVEGSEDIVDVYAPGGKDNFYYNRFSYWGD